MFFKQYLSRIIDKPLWLPEIFALEDFVVNKSGLKLSDPLSQLANLYKVYKNLEQEKAKPFSDFVPWGTMLLADFDEIDQYLAEGEKVFSYLNEIKALQHWNPDGVPLTAFEQEYLKFYNSLAPCYTKFREKLLSEGVAYFGLAFEKLLETSNEDTFNEWDSIVFAGFNALTAAEEKLFRMLISAGKAEIYWDADAYYLDDPRQEAGRFLRQYRTEKTFGELNWITDSYAQGKKSLAVTGVPGNVGQVKLAGEILAGLIQRKGSADGIALVLVDEGLLLPVLNSLPSETGDFNVTMGFPLKQTPVFSLITTVLTLFANGKRFAKVGSSTDRAESILRFYHKDIERFLSHPFIVASANKHLSGSGYQRVLSVTKSYYSSTEFFELLQKAEPQLAIVLEPFLGKDDIIPAMLNQLLRGLIVYLKSSFAAELTQGENKPLRNEPIEIEYLYHAAVLCEKLDVILSDPELITDIETVQVMVNNLISGMRLPFYGEPLNGLQVMGMLETRMLDFTDIIMLSVNEGLLPKGKNQTTFIPDEVRQQFGMQRYTDRTAVFAYHFYRLMQGVENAWLIYNSEGDEMGGGEKSRFISQMLNEMPLVNKNILITENILSVVPNSIESRAIRVPKSAEIIIRLREIAAKGLSPTSLASYMKCSLLFYFAQVLKIREPDQVSENIDAATLGEIVHESLQNLYTPYLDTVITHSILSDLISRSEKQVYDSFAARFSPGELSSGKNLLLVNVGVNMVRRLLLAEIDYLKKTSAKIELILLEGGLDSELLVKDPENESTMKVKLLGKADRIDRVGGLLRIIDYKTGRVDAKELKIDELSNLDQKKDSGKLLQVLAYALMYSDMQSEPPDEIVSGIISLRRTSEYLIQTNINKQTVIDKNMISDFRKVLNEIVNSIFDASMDFVQTEDMETCSLCSFNSICNRTVN